VNVILIISKANTIRHQMFSPKYLLAYKYQEGSFSVPVNITEAEVTSPLPSQLKTTKMPVF
jgi:hypothetical protein